MPSVCTRPTGVPEETLSMVVWMQAPLLPQPFLRLPISQYLTVHVVYSPTEIINTNFLVGVLPRMSLIMRASILWLCVHV